MSTAPKLEPPAEPSVNGFAQHIEELREYFRARGVSFGSPDDLGPFVERIDSDASFRDDLASMMRTIIYRERDGLSRPELIDVLATAAGGAEVDGSASPEIRGAIRKLVNFVEGVFRTRWNPGAAVGGPAPRLVRSQPGEGVPEQEVAPVPAGPGVHPTTDLFYRAQVVANGGVPKTLEEERKVDSVPQGDAQGAGTASEERPSEEERWHIPLEDFGGAEPERGSLAWLWIAGACALLLAFSAGVFVHQRMLVPIRDANQPYEPGPVETTAPPAAAPVARVHQPAGTTVDADWRARATKVRRTPVYVAAEPAMESSVSNLEPRFMSPATIGASPALMASRLVYAPPAGYPALAKMAHVQGKVLVQAVVGKDGQVLRAQAISGHRLLRGAAVREVYGRRYRPYLLDDRARDVATIVTVDFRLR